MGYGENPVATYGAKNGIGHGSSQLTSPLTTQSQVRRNVRPARDHFPELDCVRHRLPLDVIDDVEQRARKTGVSADRVLIAAGVINEDQYVHALSRWLGLEFETFVDRGPESCPLDDHQLMEAAKTGLLQLVIDQESVFVLAPRSAAQ